MTTIEQINAARKTEHMTDAIKYNNTVRDAWINVWVRNAARNYTYIEEEFAKKNADITQLAKNQGKPCLILASGPSLDEAAPYLKQWEGDIWCSTSQLSLLEYLGVEPTYCTYIDADPRMLHLITDHYRNGTSAKLITHPQMPLEALKLWGGEKYFFRMFDPGDEFSVKWLPMMYGAMNVEKKWHLGSYVLNSGCVANTMIALAQVLGYSPIFLAGYDLGYPGNQRRFTDYRKDENGEWQQQPVEMVPPERPVFSGNNGITTDELGCFYKLSLMIMYGLGQPELISCSRGILSELPWASITEVVRQQGKGFAHLKRNPFEKYQVAQAYLKHRGVYVLRTKKRVETANISQFPFWKRIKHKIYFWWQNRWSKKQARTMQKSPGIPSQSGVAGV